jgi:inosine-uridine nucleoside N-ribohydrolase
MNKKFYQSLASAEQPELKLSYELLNMFVERIGPDRFYNDVYFWDGLAAMVMLDSTLAESVKMPLLIDATNGQVKVAKKGAPHAADVDVITRINNPEAALLNYVAMVKSNHIYAQRQFHHINRVTANLGRSSNQYAGVKFARVSGE